PPHRRPHSFPTRRSSDLAFDALKDALDALDPQDDLAYEDEPGDTTLERRLIAHRQQVFYGDDLSSTPLALGELESLALPYETYQDRKSTRLNSSHVKISY